VLIYMALCALLLLAPGVRDLLLRIVTPGAFWLLAYSFVVPLWAGLAIAALYRGALGRKYRLAGALSFILLAGTLWAKVPALNGTVLALPGLKFPQHDLQATQQIAATTPVGAVVLADYRIATILGLLRPDVRFIVTRPVDTSMIFSNAGQKREGELRAAAGMALVTCNFSKLSPIRATEVWPDLKEIVAPAACAPELVRRALGLTDAWHVAVFSGYRQWTR